MKRLVFFGFGAVMWAVPQQVSLTSTATAIVTLPASAPYSTLSTFHIEWRATVPASVVNSPAWNDYNQGTWVIGGGYQARVYGVPFGAGPYTGYAYLINDNQDSPAGQFPCPTLNFGQDAVIRVQKWPTYMTCETWNVDGSQYQVTINSSQSFRNVPGIGVGGPLQIGGTAYNQGTMAFFRGYTGNIALNSKPPFGATGGDLWDYEFNGNLTDSSSHHLRLLPTGTFSYSGAAVYPPACVLPTQTTFRAGTPVATLTGANSFPLDGGLTLTYNWQQIPSNSTGLTVSFAQFSSQTVVNPILQGLIVGSYMLQLTVTDGSGQSTTCSMKYGAVATDSNGSVIVSNPVHAQILGPITAAFASPWAAEPQQHIAYSNLMIQKLAGTSPLQFEFVDYWNQAQAGTVTVTNGSQAVTGVGTSFKSLFCGGGTTPVNAASTSIVVWYPIASSYGLPAGTTGRRIGAVQSCTDDTHLTAQFETDNTRNWITDTYIGAGSGLSFAYLEQSAPTPNSIGGWAYGPAPGNYYDDVKALYAAWYRTGIDDYLVAARTLADRWWSYPSIDKGMSYETSHLGNTWGFTAFQNRQLALTGLFMRNADSPPYDYGPGIRTIINALIGEGTPNGADGLFQTCSVVGPANPPCGQDVREQGYALGWVALDALVNSCASCASPNPGQVTLDQGALSRDMTNRWGQCQANNGLCTQYDNIFSYYSSWIIGNFKASVTNGSNVVTAIGGTWDPTKFTSCSTPCSTTNAPNAIWITSTGIVAPTSNSQGDGGWYYVIYQNPTQLSLTDVTGQMSVKYTGRTNPTAGWQTITYTQASSDPAWLGYYWQPYMTGILNQSFLYVSLALASSDPTNAANAATWALNNAEAMATIGLNVSTQEGFTTNGPYYAIGITCPGAGPGVIYPGSGCDSGLLADRALSSEALNVATIALRMNPFSRVALNLGNTMMAAMFAQPGESGFDGTNILGNLINPGFFYTTALQHKWLGAFWGVGADWSWASTRLGGLRPPILRVVQVSLDFERASQAVLTVVSPDGTSSQVTCTSSPCPVTIDVREGDHLLSIKYLNPANQVLILAKLTIIKAQ